MDCSREHESIGRYQLQTDLGLTGYILAMLSVMLHIKDGGSETDPFVFWVTCVAFLSCTLLVYSYDKLSQLRNLEEDPT